MDRVKIKEKAKKLIKNNLWNIWKPYLIILAITFGISFVITLIFDFEINSIKSNIVDLVISFITLPLTIGYISFLLKFIRNEKPEIKDIFSKMNDIIPIFVVNILVGLAVGTGIFFLIIPGIILGLMFAMTSYLIADGQKNIGTVLNDSISMMKGYKWDFFKFYLSFLGWMLLGIVTLGVAFIYVLPYMNVSMTLYYDELKKKQLLNKEA